MQIKTAQSAMQNAWSDKNDQQLIEQIAQGNKTAMSELISRYYHRILDFVIRHMGGRADAEDIVQETFIRVWRKAPTWQDRQIPLLNWIYRISHNLCLDELRKHQPLFEAEQPEPIAQEGSLENQVFQLEQMDILKHALQSLSTAQRTAIILCSYQGLSNRDAATIMDTSVEAVESLLRRGRSKLRNLLIDKSGIQP